MNPFEISIVIAFVCLGVALAIMSFKIRTYEQYFKNINEILMTTQLIIQVHGEQIHELKKEKVTNL